MEREMETKIIELKGHNKACKNCGKFFKSVRSDAKYCSGKCKSQYYKKKLKRKARLQSLLSVFGLGSNKIKSGENGQEQNKKQGSKIEYARLTFILSVLGFIGSIGFYLSVLREVYSPAKDKYQIEQLQEQNQQLQNTIIILTEDLAENG